MSTDDGVHTLADFGRLPGPHREIAFLPQWDFLDFVTAHAAELPPFRLLLQAEATGLWVAQDTGGAIKGANRFDTFWGAGADATRIAGGMSASGQALILLPKGVAARVPQR